MDVEYRKAVMEDLKRIVVFVDFWLTGGGIPDGVPGAGHDFFVPYGRHKAYLEKYQVLLAIYEGAIVGWAVKTKKGVLIHLLVAGTFRGDGIGSVMLGKMNPEVVRSKFDQSTGDPSGFYRKHGYVKASSTRLGRKKNIEIFARKGVDASEYVRRLEKKAGPAKKAVDVVGVTCSKSGRAIDITAGKCNLVRKNSDKYSY